MKPDFIIIGAMKSATSTLHEQLALQSGVYMSTPKEPNFFSDDEIFEKGEQWYRGLFSGAETDALCGESSTHYTKLPDYPETLQRMKSVLPAPKFIYVLRHPVERLVSHYIHQWSQNVIHSDINSAIDEFPELVNYSLYQMQLKPYIDCYGAENILIVFSEALRENPEEKLQKIADFLGYDGKVKWYTDLPEQNVSSERLRKFNGYKFLVESPFMSFIRKAFVPTKLREYIKSKLRMKNRPVIDNPTLEHLQVTFEEDLAKLSKLLGQEITLENYCDVARDSGVLRLKS